MKIKLTRDWQLLEVGRIDYLEWYNQDDELLHLLETISAHPDLKEIEEITGMLQLIKQLKDGHKQRTKSQKNGLTVIVRGVYGYLRMWYIQLFVDIQVKS